MPKILICNFTLSQYHNSRGMERGRVLRRKGEKEGKKGEEGRRVKGEK
mgnify:CR=1 FL=1